MDNSAAKTKYRPRCPSSIASQRCLSFTPTLLISSWLCPWRKMCTQWKVWKHLSKWKLQLKSIHHHWRNFWLRTGFVTIQLLQSYKHFTIVMKQNVLNSKSISHIFFLFFFSNKNLFVFSLFSFTLCVPMFWIWAGCLERILKEKHNTILDYCGTSIPVELTNEVTRVISHLPPHPHVNFMQMCVVCCL